MGRISARIAAINESATLAVDAKAKALKAAGENVIGFGAGEPDFPTPAARSSRPRSRPRREPRFHHYSPTPGSARAARGDRAQDQARLRRRLRGRAGARHQRRQARRLQHVPGALRPGRRGAAARAVLDVVSRDASRSAAACRSCCRRPRSTGFRVTIEQLEAAVHAAHEGVAVRVAEQPDRRGVPARRGRGDRPVGARARHLGRHRRDLRAPHVRRSRVLVDARPRARARRPVRRSSTASPRRTR